MIPCYCSQGELLLTPSAFPTNLLYAAAANISSAEDTGEYAAKGMYTNETLLLTLLATLPNRQKKVGNVPRVYH